MNDFHIEAANDYDQLVDVRLFHALINERSVFYHLWTTLRGVYLSQVVTERGHRGRDFSTVDWRSEPAAGNYEGLMEKRLKSYRRRLRVPSDKTRGVGGVCVGLATEIDWKDDDFYDFFHNTPKGTRKIGTYLHRELRELL